MIKGLQSKIEKKIKRKIKTRGDCEYLSERIHIELNRDLSYNTIRRTFGVQLDCNIKPRNSTLDILSQFIEYDSFDSYQRENTWRKEWSLQIQICGWINRMDGDELIFELNSSWIKNEKFTIIFVSVLRELFLLRKFELAENLIREANINLESLSYSELLYIGNGVGSILPKIKIEEQDLVRLLKNNFFVEYIFLLFVDYSSLSGYYGLLYFLIKRHKIELRKEQVLFFQAIEKFRKLLTNQKIELINFQSINKESLHPILIGRLASIEIAACKQKGISYDYILHDLIIIINASNKPVIDYLYELKSVALLLGDFFLMEWICKEENYIIKEEYQVAHKQFSFIIQLLLAIHKKDDKECLAILKKIDNKKWILSYHSYINIFNFIGNYHFTKDKHEKNKLLQQYNKLCASLNYPLFDEKYLKNYFN
jgi:hypothetical protein